MRFTFQGTTPLVDWRQSDAERLAAVHSHWGGPAFWVPANCPLLLTGGASRGSQLMLAGPGPMAAAARPDTARGPRPSSRQMSRLGMPSSAGAVGADGGPLASSRSLVAANGALASSHSRGSGSMGGGGPHQAYLCDAESGPLTARQPEPACGLQQLGMAEVVEAVRRSCPYVGGASLRIRVQLSLLG